MIPLGPLYRGRTAGMNPYKEQLAQITNRNGFQGAMPAGFVGRDIFIGVSKPHMVSQDMIRSMAKNAIVFPLSNPIGEIDKEDAVEAGAAIVADGRDINNALPYPGIFRAASTPRRRILRRRWNWPPPRRCRSWPRPASFCRGFWTRTFTGRWPRVWRPPRGRERHCQKWGCSVRGFSWRVPRL